MEKCKVLILEDSNTMSVDLLKKLNQRGYKVQEVVTSGEKALIEIQNKRPDIILIDVQIKGRTSGIDAAVAIRESYDIPIIFTTTLYDQDIVSRAKVAEAYAYLLKPLNGDELIATIEHVLYKHEKFVALKREKELFHSMIDTRIAQDFLFVRADYKLNKIKLEDIYFIEALKDYVVINTSDNIYTTHSTMKQMMRILPTKDFVRIHRSYITRFDKIFSIKYPDLVVEGKMKILPIGGLYRRELYKKLNIL